MPSRNRRARGRNARRPAPIDLVHAYLTPAEAFGPTFNPAEAENWLRTTDQEAILVGVAYWLARFDATDLSGWRAIGRDFVARSFVEPHRSRTLQLLRDDRLLVGPQALLMAAKIAIADGAASELRDHNGLLVAALSIQGRLSPGPDEHAAEDGATRRNRLLHEIVRNYAFHLRPERGTRIAQSYLRWHAIPERPEMAGNVHVADAFARVTGVPLLDFQALGFFLFAQAEARPGGVVDIRALGDRVGWDMDRIGRVLRLIAAPMATLADEIRRDEERYGDAWSFDAFRRFPVILLDANRLLVVSPHLMLERALGWLPFYDMAEPEGHLSPEAVRLARRAKTAFEMICERDAVLSLEVNARGGRRRARLFDGQTLRETYPAGEIADAAIACGDTWIVVEVSTRTLGRATVVGGRDEGLQLDLVRGIEEKARQIESTIADLRADGDRLARDGRRRRRYVPVLVVAEGFPVNPITWDLVQGHLATAGLFAAGDTEALHILDMEDLYVAESIVETDRLGLLELLDRHRHAGRMRRVDLKSWLISEVMLRNVRPTRLQALIEPGLDPLLAAIGGA